MGNWIPGVSGLSPNELVPDGQVLPNTAEDLYQLTPVSAATNSANEVIEGDFVDAADDAAFNVPSFTAGVLSGNRENAVLTGLPREGYDWLFDYDGTWGGQEDQHDITGPSFDPDGNWLGYNSEQAEDDPTRPTNWSALVWAGVAALVFGVLAYLTRPFISLLVNATEGEG